MTEKKYTITEQGNVLCIAEIRKQITGYFDSYQKEDLIEIVDLLNEQDTKIKQLKSRNKRQYELLKKYSDLMFARDWKTLEKIVEETEKQEELLQKEFRCDVE